MDEDGAQYADLCEIFFIVRNKQDTDQIFSSEDDDELPVILSNLFGREFAARNIYVVSESEKETRAYIRRHHGKTCLVQWKRLSANNV